MDFENETQNTLRDEIEKQFDAVEAAPTEQHDTNEAPATTQRERDEKGRFSTKTTVSEQQTEAANPVEEEPPRPKGWKKDYVPMWDKMYRGEALTPEEAKQVALYANQRESEFAHGVSTYKAEADRVKAWDAAIQPILPRLQQMGSDPVQYVSGLAQVDNMLTHGSPQQKIQALAQIAQASGIPLSVLGQAVQGDGQTNPIVNDLLSRIDALNQQVTQVSAWRQQQETAGIQSTIDQFKNSGKAPHFEAVRPTIAQLLESGVAANLEDAYDKAIRLNDDIWQQEQKQKQEAANNAAIIQKAKSAAVSVKSTAPRGNPSGGGPDPHDLRATIAAGLESQKY